MYVFFFQVSSGYNNTESRQFYFKNGIDSDLSYPVYAGDK